MSLSHVYIVLEPVGSARLTFDDDRYYGFMCFDVPKVVRSLGCDHDHDEESRNGRDINIDILEGYVGIPKRFQVVRALFRSTGRLPEPHEELMGINGPRWKRGGGGQGGGAPQAQSELGRGLAPLSFSPSSLPSPS